MNKTRLVILPFVLLACSAPMFSQDSQDAGQDNTPQSSRPSTVNLCQDGSLPSIGSDGRTSCPDGTNALPETTGLRSRPNTSADPAEDETLSNARKLRDANGWGAMPPEQLTEFQKFVAATTGQYLPIYGSKLFRNVPSTFAPDNVAPAASDYVVGPDDELRIRIWGQVNYTGNLRVDRSGAIHLPEVGTVQVAGLQFSALDQHLRAAVARIYRNFDLSVDMGKIRSIQIYVTGQARRAGVYTVSALSSLVDALFASGGPSPQGSMRHLELRRNGKTITDFDLYQLLIRGDKSKDARLLPEDVIYIPAVGPQVAIAGSVQTPAVYELRGDETIGDLIDMAGKTTAISSNKRVSVERLGERQVRQAMEFQLDDAGLRTALAGGDIVRVFSITPSYQNTITLRGDVANPGRFAWHDGMHLSDLIPDRDSLLSRDYWWKRNRLGLPTPEFEPNVRDFAPNVHSQGQYPEEPGSQSSMNPYETQTPSSKPVNPYESAEYPGQSGSQIQDAASGSNAADNAGQMGSGTLASRYEQMDGSSSSTGRQFQRNEVKLAAPEIDWSYAVIERLDHNTLKTSLIPFDLGKLVMDHDAAQNLALQPGDVVTVFSQADVKVPLEQQTKYVRLDGEFVHSGTYSVMPGETLRDVVRRAGGLTAKAYLYGSEFDRESTRVLQQQRIDEYVRRVDLDAGRGTLALTASATSSSGSVANTGAATAAEQALLSRLKQIRATGRIVLRFAPDTNDMEAIPDISLENGDKFTVPPAPATINVVGAVYDQNSFLYRKHGSAGRYLQMAGGPDRDADWRHTFVIRADGSVVSRESVKNLWGNDFRDLILNPGDTIIVPDKTLRPTALRGLLDWTQIFSQLAIGAAAVEVLR